MDMSTDYMGLKLKNPIVPSSSPLSHSVDSIRRLEDAGAAAVVMYSLFEQIFSLAIGYQQGGGLPLLPRCQRLHGLLRDLPDRASSSDRR